MQERLIKALENLLNSYTSLVASGDCGNWDVETEAEVIEARAALSAVPAQEPLQKQLEEITRRHDQQVRINKRLIKAWKDAQQPAQEPVGEVQHYAAPANLPAYVNMKWYGKPPKNGTKLYTAPVKQEACDDGAACGVGGYCITCPNVSPVEVQP